MNNQQVLQAELDSNRRLRQQTLLVREAQANKAAADMGMSLPNAPAASQSLPQETDSMGNILIDSPQHHYYPRPPVADSSGGFATKALPWLLAAALGAGTGGYALNNLINKPTPPTVSGDQKSPSTKIINTATGLGIEFIQPDKVLPTK